MTTNPGEDRWLAADEWMSDFLAKLAASPGRMRRVRREVVDVPEADQMARDYEHETEQMRRFLRGEARRSA